MDHSTSRPGPAFRATRSVPYAPLFYAEEVNPGPESVELHSGHRWWCALRPAAGDGDSLEDHGDRCRSLAASHSALSDDGHRWDVSAELTAAHFEGVYVPDAEATDRAGMDWIGLTLEKRHGDYEEQTVNVSPATARQLAARLLHLADLSDRVGAGALLWEARAR